MQPHIHIYKHIYHACNIICSSNTHTAKTQKSKIIKPSFLLTHTHTIFELQEKKKRGKKDYGDEGENKSEREI